MCNLSERDDEIVLEAINHHILGERSFTGFDVWMKCKEIAERGIFSPDQFETSARVRELFNNGAMIFVDYGVTKTNGGQTPLLYFPVPKAIKKHCHAITISDGKYVHPKKSRYAKAKSA